jgi:hypothetical protein
MKTYFSDIIPKIQKFSQKLDNLTLLTNQHWVVIDDIDNIKRVYIFRTNNELLISQNGKVEKAKWEYLGNNSILIDRKEESYLFKHGFFDENVLALKIDSSNEYAFLVNETKFDNEINTANGVIEFLDKTYIYPQIHQKITKSLDYNGVPESIAPKYKAPNYKITNITEKKTFFGGVHKIHAIQFEDGIGGDICIDVKSNMAYFTDIQGFLRNEYHYETFDFAVNALHSLFSTGKYLNDGLIDVFG